MYDRVCTPAAHYSHFQHSFAFVCLTSFVIKSLDLLAFRIYDIVSVFFELAGKSLTESQMNAVWGLTLCLKSIHTLHTLSFPLPWPCCISVCGSLVSKLISGYLQARGCMNALFPLLPQYDVFPFLCVFWSLSCGQAPLWWGAGSSGAPVLFLAAAVVGGCWGERRQKGISWSPKNQRLFKGFLSGGIAL